MRCGRLARGGAGGAWLARDPRMLGVAVRRIVLRQGTRFRIIDAADPLLTDGFHMFEPDTGIRWTDGDAAIPERVFDAFAGPLEVVLHLGAATRYLAPGFRAARAIG